MSRIGAALIAAIGLQASLTTVVQFMPGPGRLYGAPLPVGTSYLGLFGGAGVPFGEETLTFYWYLFLIDVVITWGIFLAPALRWRSSGLVALLIVPHLSLAVALMMALSGLPLAGVPVPLLPGGPLPISQVLWTDMVIWGISVAFFVHHRSRARRSASGMAGTARPTA